MFQFEPLNKIIWKSSFSELTSILLDLNRSKKASWILIEVKKQRSPFLQKKQIEITEVYVCVLINIYADKIPLTKKGLGDRHIFFNVC